MTFQVGSENKICFLFHSTHPRRVWHALQAKYCDLDKFQSTHPRRVWRRRTAFSLLQDGVQSTHPRRVWPDIDTDGFFHFEVSIHTPTKGVTIRATCWQSLRDSFNPHTHEGCDIRFVSGGRTTSGFNPHTHEGYDRARQPNRCPIIVSIHTPTKGVTIFYRKYNIF